VPSVSHLTPIHLGLDVHKDTISVGILPADQQVPDVERIPHDEASIRRLVGRLGNPRSLRACYEAGPTGFELARLLHSLHVRCEVIAPSLIPKAPGDKVKTDRRDCRRLARLHRAGELVCVRIPTVQEEAVRDLCRTRGDMVEDLTRARNRLGKFLLRHGRVWRGGSTWTLKHQAWLGSQRFEQPAMAQTFGHYLAVVEVRNAHLDAVEADLAGWCDRPPFDWQVARLAAYRGITRLGALTLAAEVADWRRFATASQFMGFCGLVPSEYSSGTSVHRGPLTKAGNAHLRAQLVESAWAYRHHPPSACGSPAVSRACPQRSPPGRGKPSSACAPGSGSWPPARTSESIVAAAIARELAGFLWAEMTA
jgi:transposase